MEGKTNFSRRLKQFDGLTWLTMPPWAYFTTDLIYATDGDVGWWFRERSHWSQLHREGGKFGDRSVRAHHVRASCQRSGFVRRPGWIRRRVVVLSARRSRTTRRHVQRHVRRCRRPLSAAGRPQLPDVRAGCRQSRHVQRSARVRVIYGDLGTIQSMAEMHRSRTIVYLCCVSKKNWHILQGRVVQSRCPSVF